MILNGAYHAVRNLNGGYQLPRNTEGSIGGFSSPLSTNNRPFLLYDGNGGILQSQATSDSITREQLRATIQEALNILSDDTDRIGADHEEAGGNSNMQHQ
jgi:hypothetical protein